MNFIVTVYSKIVKPNNILGFSQKWSHKVQHRFNSWHKNNYLYTKVDQQTSHCTMRGAIAEQKY